MGKTMFRNKCGRSSNRRLYKAFYALIAVLGAPTTFAATCDYDGRQDANGAHVVEQWAPVYGSGDPTLKRNLTATRYGAIWESWGIPGLTAGQLRHVVTETDPYTGRTTENRYFEICGDPTVIAARRTYPLQNIVLANVYGVTKTANMFGLESYEFVIGGQVITTDRATLYHGGYIYQYGTVSQPSWSANGKTYRPMRSYRPSLNTAPQVSNKAMSLAEDSSANIVLSASDPDTGDSHTFHIVSAPNSAHGTASISGNRLYFTPRPNWNGTTTLSYRAKDAHSADSNIASVTVTVHAVNDVPAVSSFTHTMSEDTAPSITLPVSDVDLGFEGDSHTFSIVTGPGAEHGSAAISGNQLVFTPSANWNGTTTLSYKARDSRGAESNTAQLTIVVSPENDSPSVPNLSLALEEDSPGTVVLPVADVDLSYEGDTHTWQIVSQPNSDHGRAEINGNQMTFTPVKDWNGTSTVTYRALDSKGAYSNTATVTVIVAPLNDSPSVSDLAETTPEDTPKIITLPVSDVDLRYEGDSHIFSLVSEPNAAHGTASISDNQLTFTPESNWNGVATLTFQARDSKGADSNIGTVTITVTPVNDAPAVTDLALQTDEDKEATIKLPVSDVDLHFENDTHTWHVVSAPDEAIGLATINDNELTFTPARDWNGSATVTYRAQDSQGAVSNTASVSVTVRPVNDAPSVSDLTHTMDEDTSASITLPVSDIDLSFEGDIHTWHIVSPPSASEATATIVGNKLTFIPTKDWFGVATLTYKVRDSHGAESTPATVKVTVVNVNDPPVVQPLSLTTLEDTEIRTPLEATDIDSEESYEFELIGSVDVLQGVIGIESNTLVFMPAENWNGYINLAYRAKDPEGDWSESAPIAIEVTAVNDPPNATGAKISALEGQQADAVEPWVVDPDIKYGDTHTFEIVSEPSYGSASLKNGRIIYSPAGQYVGPDGFQIKATDSAGAVVTGEVVVEVSRYNYAPDDILPGNVTMYKGVGGTAVLSVSDTNLWDEHTLEVASQPDKGVVTIDGKTITYRTASADNAVVRIRATDKGGLSFEKEISLEMVSAWRMIEGREVVSLDYSLKLPAIAAQLQNSRGNYALQVSNAEAIKHLGDDMVLVIDPSSSVGAQIEDRGLNPGEGMRFVPHIHENSRIESKAGALQPNVPGEASLLLSRADMTGPAYRIPATMWTLAAELSSSEGWSVLQGVGQTRIGLKPIEPICAVNTNLNIVKPRNLLDDPYCFVRWETVPEESRNTSNSSVLQMDTVGRSVGVHTIRALAFVYDNAGDEHLIGSFENELIVEPLAGLVTLDLMPKPTEVYQSIQDLSLVLRLAGDSFSCDLTTSEAQARKIAGNWSLRPTCFVNWTTIPDGLKQADNWSTPQLRGAINGVGEQTIDWSVSVYTPEGHPILVTEQSHTVNVIAPPAIEIGLPDTPSRISDSMYSVASSGGFVGSAVITAVPADIHIKTMLDLEVDRDEVVPNYGRAVRMTTPIKAIEAPLWTVTPFTIEASYARLLETTAKSTVELLAVPPDSVLPVILNEERVVLDTNEFIVSAQIQDTRYPSDGYATSKHGDWDLRLVKAMPGGVYEPITDCAMIDETGRVDFPLDLTDLSNQVMRVHAEARVRSPVPEYVSHRRSVSPLALSILNGNALESELTTLRLIGLAPLRTTFFVNTVERWESRDIGDVRWEISSDAGATWEEQPHTGNVVQRLSRIFPKGRYLVRAHVQNRHSGAMSVTPSVEVIAFEVPDARLQGPQNVFLGDTGEYSLTNPDGTPFDSSGIQVEWSEDRGQTWVEGGSTYELSSETAQRFYLQARLKFEDAPEHRLAYKNLRIGVAFRAIRPPRVQMIGPRRPEVGREATWKANMMMPYPNMGLEMDGFFILPDGTVAESREVQYTPTYEDFEREESYLSFDARIIGFEDVGGRGVTKHRLIFWSYDWPEWVFQVKSSAIYSPADVTVTLRNLGIFREFENLQVEWEVFEGEGLTMTRDTSSLSRSFTITEPGTYLVAAHISDGRGNYSYVEQELVFYTPPEWGVDLTWSGDNPFNRAPMDVLLRPQYSGGHPRDRIEVKEYFHNGELMDSSGDYGRATLNAGTHEIRMRIATMMGYEAFGRTSITVKENIAPVCSIEVTPGRTSWLAKSLCTDEDGRVSTYRWWINGEEQTITSSSISVPMWRYPDGEPIITLVGIDDSGDESEPVAQK